MAEIGRYTGPRLPRWSLLVGSAGLAGTGGIHLYLYLERGYRHIPTIGPLFLATVLTAGLMIAVLGRVRSLLVGLLSAGFLLSVFVGYLLSASVALFGFREVGETAEVWLAACAELGGAAALLVGMIVALSKTREKVSNPTSETAAASY